MSGPPTIGVDVGGTKIAGAVVDGDGAIVARRLVPTESDEPTSIVAAILKVTRELKAAAPAAAAVGVGAAGLVDTKRGVILGAPNLAYRNVPVRDTLGDRLGLPVVVDNDANVAALAEAIHGAGRGAGDQIMVTVGTGIGGGIIIGGHVYRGHYGVGAELGHIVIDPDGPICGCGNRGCWEAVASGTALGRLARQRVEGGAGADLLASVGGDLDAITGELVGEAALAGSPFAKDVVAEIGRLLGIGFASIVNIFDPEVIVVGGGAAAGTGELLLGPARESMLAHVLGISWRTPVRIVPAALGNDAGVVGAATLALELL
ncbi:MAG: ROK family glucokinase [Actinomycetota bacterium]